MKLKTIAQSELNEVLKNHKIWLADNSKGIRADLSHANLNNANLTHANLSYANLSYANLYNANLSNANLSHANLNNADLINSNLAYVNLANAYLSNAYLSNAHLSNAHLSYAYLSNVKYSLNQLPYLKVCNYYENNKWVRFEESDKYKQDLIKLTIMNALKSKVNNV